MIIVAHTKEYLNWKISNCQRLVENATSEEQKKIYQGYLDFWTGKLPKTQRPEVIAQKAEKKAQKLLEEKAELARLELIKRAEEEEVFEAERIELEKAAKRAKLEAELAALQAEEVVEQVEIVIDENSGETELFEETSLGKIFELENPNKKAYRIQNGNKLKTIAFKEYLIKRTQ